MNTLHDVVIVGSGPAGYTAALYNARANLNPIIFAGLQPGGQLTITTEVENYPGYPDGILGPEMMDMFRRQVERFGTVIHDRQITKVDFSARPFRLWSDDEEISARAVIVATGASAKWIGLPSEITYGGFGVSACATCDGFFFRNKEVAVVGGGDTAMEEAHYLAKMCAKVHLIHRRDEFRASKIMQERVLNDPKVEVHWNTAVDEILGQTEPVKRVQAVRLMDTKTQEKRELPLAGVFVAIGHKPNTDLFRGVLAMDENGYLIVEKGGTRTNVPGVFAAGDVADHVYRQAITAAGSGCMAAIDAERFLALEPHA